jgi:hypothetical protein
VVFRGTDADDPRNIGTDADLLLRSWTPGGQVHSGFFGALHDIEAQLGPVVKAMGCPVLFTGHSLGAALATLAASLYRTSVAGDSALYTFGSPLVGDASFAATLNGMPGARYVDCSDAVTRIPPPVIYTHICPPQYINRDGEITFDPSEFVIAGDRLAAEAEYAVSEALKPANVPVRILADHIPLNYVYAVTA